MYIKDKEIKMPPKKEYEKAVFYNKNLTAATTVLTSL
jgi:hypothetical protein